jgi:hypothetical protein
MDALSWAAGEYVSATFNVFGIFGEPLNTMVLKLRSR